MATAGAQAQRPFVSVAPRLGFIGGFDGVRGIGILGVLFNHAYSPLFPSIAGIIDVFFLMSAFLITSLLLQEHRDSQTIDMRKFYARRGVRLLPSAYLCILAWLVVTILFARYRLHTLLGEAADARLEDACAAVTVKLSKIGGLDAGLGGHLPTYLSSALDGPVGIAAAAHVAQTLDPGLPWPGMAHGLATGRLFEEELSANGPLTTLNELDPPANGFGLGVELDEGVLSSCRL